MTDTTTRLCAKCGQPMQWFEQYKGDDYLHPVCRLCWQAAEDGAQLRLPEAPTPSLFDALDGESKP